MNGRAYYNEFDPYAVQWLRNLIAAGHIAPGEVDERSICDVQPDDLKGFAQCHFFAGIGGWSLALRMAGWDDSRFVWTGSCPCQPFSSAGKGKGQTDERHLWPVWFNLINECRPSIVFGEQVASAIAHGWWDDVASDLEAESYSCAASVLPACSVGAPHKRDRLWFVANAEGKRSGGACGSGGEATWRSTGGDGLQPGGASKNSAMAESSSARFSQCDREGTPATRQSNAKSKCSGLLRDVANSECDGRQGQGEMGESVHTEEGGNGKASEFVDDSAGFWWLKCPDGKTRPVKPGIRLLANGVPARVGKLRAYGNAIVPALAAEFIKAYQESRL